MELWTSRPVSDSDYEYLTPSSYPNGTLPGVWAPAAERPEEPAAAARPACAFGCMWADKELSARRGLARRFLCMRWLCGDAGGAPQARAVEARDGARPTMARPGASPRIWPRFRLLTRLRSGGLPLGLPRGPFIDIACECLAVAGLEVSAVEGLGLRLLGRCSRGPGPEGGLGETGWGAPQVARP